MGSKIGLLTEVILFSAGFLATVPCCDGRRPDGGGRGNDNQNLFTTCHRTTVPVKMHLLCSPPQINFQICFSVSMCTTKGSKSEFSSWVSSQSKTVLKLGRVRRALASMFVVFLRSLQGFKTSRSRSHRQLKDGRDATRNHASHGTFRPTRERIFALCTQQHTYTYIYIYTLVPPLQYTPFVCSIL